MSELDYKESWALKNWCFWTVVLEKTLESPLDCKEIQSVPPKGDQSWVFIGRTDAEAETPILWPPDVKNWLIWKDPDERLKVREEGDDRGWDGWMASLAQWTRVWVNSQRWWRTGNPGVLKFMESQRIRHDLATEQQLDIKNKMVETTVLKFHCICLHAVWLSPHTHFPFLLSWKSSKV